MRITTGIYKGRIISAPKGIRPTQDKVRKALFDILGDIEGLSFLELFAGSGAVGLEAASRGAGEVVLVESSRDCQLAIRRNIEAFKPKTVSLIGLESDKAIQALHRNGKKFDLIFLDPPYYEEGATPNLKGKVGVQFSAAKKALQTLGAYDILAPNGLVVAQHFKRDELPKEAAGQELIKEARYGDTVLSFYRKDCLAPPHNPRQSSLR